MFLRQIPDPHLAQYAYLIGCQRTGEAIVIDPERDVDRYRKLAAENGLRITAVAETHIHADFVSGARELVMTNPQLRLYVSGEGGPEWQVEWANGLSHVTRLRDGGRFRVGNMDFQAVHTPGHTPEHMIYLVTDRGGGADEPVAMLSGDFLFVGDAGRPDLLEQAAGLEGTQEPGARALYRSLRKVSEMPCHLQVLPAHGAGSACGKALGAVPNSTLGYEEKFNPALKLALESGEEAFVRFILSGQPEPPAYFAHMKHLNRVGPAVLDGLPAAPILSLPSVVARLDEPDFVVLDTRDRPTFLAGHLRGSLFTPPGSFSDFAGSYLQPQNRVVLVLTDPSAPEEWIRQLVRMGFDQVIGVLPATLLEAAPPGQIARLPAIRFEELPALLAAEPESVLLDVRKAMEFATGHLRGARNQAHTRLLPQLNEVPADRPLVVSCGSGMRAAGACAFLARTGRRVTCVADHFEHAPRELVTETIPAPPTLAGEPTPR